MEAARARLLPNQLLKSLPEPKLLRRNLLRLFRIEPEPSTWSKLRFCGFRSCHHRLQLFRLPAHGGGDPSAATGMVKEEELLHPARIQFAVLAQFQGDLGLAVRLLAGIQAKYVRFVLHGTRDRVFHWGKNKCENRKEQHRQGDDRDIRDAPHSPIVSPARQASVQAPVQEGESDER